MNISLIILRANPARGGAERYTADLAASLATRGHRLTILSTEFGSPIPNVNFIELQAPSSTRLGAYIKFLNAIDSHLAQNPYDITHAMLPVRQCDFYHPHAGLAAESIQTGHLKHAHPARRAFSKLANRLNRKRSKFAQVEQTLLTSRNPVVLCLSEHIKSIARLYFPDPNLPLEKLFNGVDLNKFDPTPNPSATTALREKFHIAPDETLALIIAQDFARKGLARAIRAIAALNHPTLRLLVVGKEDPAPYAALARQFNIPNQIIFAGPTTTPRDFYQAADFFLLPTSHDPCSLVVLEALAMGLPVISTQFNGACEIMQNGIHGFVLPEPDDIPALSQAMKQLLDPTRRQQMQQACLSLRRSLSFNTHVDRLEALYRARRSL